MQKTYKRIIFLAGILLFSECLALVAQLQKDSFVIDSLKTRISRETDNYVLADIFYELSDLYYGSDFDSSLLYANKYLESANVSKDIAFIADAYNNIAYIYDRYGNLTLAIENFQKALDGYIEIEDSVMISSSYVNLGYVISYGADQAKALNYFLESMLIAESIQDSSLISVACVNIAYFYERLKDFKTAFEYYKTALDLDLPSNDSLIISMSYANMANINLQLKDYSEAESQLALSKNYLSSKNEQYDLAYLYTTYIETYLDWGLLDSARKYIMLVDSVMADNKYVMISAFLYRQKAFLSYAEHDYKKCLKYLDESLKIYAEVGGKEEFSRIYTKKADAYSKLKMYEEAYNAQLLANENYDSLNYGKVAGILSKHQQEKLYLIRTKNSNLEYALAKQEIENANIRAKANLRFAIIILGLLLILISLTIFFLLRLRKKNAVLKSRNDQIGAHQKLLEINIEKVIRSEEDLKKLNSTKDRFFSIIAHDLKTPLSSIVGLSNLYLSKDKVFKAEDVTRIMESLNATANYGFNLLENLLEWAMSNTGEMIPRPTRIQVGQMLKTQISGFNNLASAKNIAIEFSGHGNAFIFADANMLNTILRNLIHNAIKFSNENSIIRIFTKGSASSVVISIVDQGIGISEEGISLLFNPEADIQRYGTKNEKGTGLGLLLCQDFVTKNNGEIWAESNPGGGCTFSVSLPLYVEQGIIES